MPDFNQINNNNNNKNSKSPYSMESSGKKFPGIKEAFQKGGKEMWIYIAIIIVVVGIIIAIIAGTASHNNKVKQQQAAQNAGPQISASEQAVIQRKATRQELNKQNFEGAVEAAGLTLDTKTTANTLKKQGNMLVDYSLALGNKRGKAYDAAMEYRDFKSHADALAFTMNYCTAAVDKVPGVKPHVYYFDNQGGEISADATGYYFRAYCYGDRVVAVSCSADQKDNINRIFNTVVQKQ